MKWIRNNVIFVITVLVIVLITSFAECQIEPFIESTEMDSEMKISYLRLNKGSSPKFPEATGTRRRQESIMAEAL